jgi:hypothetical protein
MPLPVAFQAALDAGRTPTLLFKITLIGGTQFLWTTWAHEVTWAGLTYDSRDLDKVNLGANSIGAQVSTFTLDAQLGGRISTDDLLYKWPNATCEVYTVFPIDDGYGNYIGDTTPGQVVYEKGLITKTDIVDPLNCTIEYEGVGRYFTKIPVYDIPIKCPLTFCEGRCPKNAADVEHVVTLTDVSADGLTIEFTATPDYGFIRGFYRPGSGLNDGLPPIGFKDATNVGTTWTCVLYDTFAYPLEIGDTGVAREGCTKDKDPACNTFFPADADHSEGWPYLGFDPPGQDWLSANN